MPAKHCKISLSLFVIGTVPKERQEEEFFLIPKRCSNRRGPEIFRIACAGIRASLEKGLRKEIFGINLIRSYVVFVSC